MVIPKLALTSAAETLQDLCIIFHRYTPQVGAMIFRRTSQEKCLFSSNNSNNCLFKDNTFIHQCLNAAELFSLHKIQWQTYCTVRAYTLSIQEYDRSLCLSFIN